MQFEEGHNQSSVRGGDEVQIQQECQMHEVSALEGQHGMSDKNRNGQHAHSDTNRLERMMTITELVP